MLWWVIGMIWKSVECSHLGFFFGCYCFFFILFYLWVWFLIWLFPLIHGFGKECYDVWWDGIEIGCLGELLSQCSQVTFSGGYCCWVLCLLIYRFRKECYDGCWVVMEMGSCFIGWTLLKLNWRNYLISKEFILCSSSTLRYLNTQKKLSARLLSGAHTSEGTLLRSNISQGLNNFLVFGWSSFMPQLTFLKVESQNKENKFSFSDGASAYWKEWTISRPLLHHLSRLLILYKTIKARKWDMVIWNKVSKQMWRV